METEKKKRPRCMQGKTTCCFYIDTDLWAKIKQICALEGMTITSFIEKLVMETIHTYEKTHGRLEGTADKPMGRSISEILGGKLFN